MTLRPDVSGTDHSIGPANAPVTLVEYGDYECPHCGRAHPIVKRVVAEMGESMRFVFRNFPLAEIHPHATIAAQAVEAARDAGPNSFWAMHDLVFEHQEHLDGGSLLRYAASAGADSNAVRDALEAGTFAERVSSDFMSGVRSGVNGTPTFFVNGARYEGAWWEFDTFLHDLRARAEVVNQGAITAARTSPSPRS